MVGRHPNTLENSDGTQKWSLGSDMFPLQLDNFEVNLPLPNSKGLVAFTRILKTQHAGSIAK